MTAVARRTFIAGTLGSLIAARAGAGDTRMYGLIGKFTAVSGQRDTLISILLGSVAKMPGCLSYVVAEDTGDPDGIWITEVWDSKESHAASLALPEVRAAITKAKPLIAGFGDHVTTRPLGGHGLVAAP